MVHCQRCTTPSPLSPRAILLGAGGLSFLVALLLTGVCALAWAKNEQIVAWLLSEGVVEESATRTLPDTVRSVTLRVGIGGLVATALAAVWAVSGIAPWAPVRALFTYLKRTLRPLADPIWSVAVTLSVACGRGIGSLLSLIQSGSVAVVQVSSRFLARSRSCLHAALEYTRLAATAGAKAVTLAVVITVYGSYRIVLSLLLATAKVAQAIGLPLGYLWRGFSTIRGCVGQVASTIVTSLGRMASIITSPIRLSIATLLRYILAGASMAVDVASAGLRGVRLAGASVTGGVGAVASMVAGLLATGVAAVVRPSWPAGSFVARAVGAGLRYGWSGVSAILGLLSTGILGVARALALVTGGLCTVASTVAGLPGMCGAAVVRPVWVGTSTVAQAVGAGLRNGVKGVSTTLGYVLTTVLFAARIIGLALHGIWLGMAAVAEGLEKATTTAGHLLGLGVATVVRPFLLAVSSVARMTLWGLHRVRVLCISPILVFVRTGVGAFLGLMALGLYTGTRTLWLGIVTVIRPFWLGSSLIVRVVHGGLKRVGQVIITILRHLWLGTSTAVLALVWVLGYPVRAVLAILRGLRATPIFVARIGWTGAGAMPDVGRLAVSMATKRKGVYAMSEFNLTRERVLSLIATVWLFGIGGFFAAWALWPAPPEPTVKVVHWATGHLMRDGKELRLLPVMAKEFNEAGHRTGSGTRIVVEAHNVPSELQADYLVTRLTSGRRIDLHGITNGYVDRKTSDSNPTIVTPSSAHWLVSANHAVGREVVALDAAQSIVGPVIGIVTYEEMARCLGWPHKQIGYSDIITLRSDPDGWSSYPCAKAEWGKDPLVAYTDPTTSSTGRSLHLALYSFAADKLPQDLTLDDVGDPEVVDYVRQFQGLIDHYLIGTTVLNTKVHQGPRYGHFFIMPEDNLIHLYEGTERAFVNWKKIVPDPIEPGSMVMIYPKEGSMPRNNCACIVQADWVTEEQVEAAQVWIDFIREDEQQRSFMSAGFRPGTDLSLTDPASKINGKYGLDPNQPTKVLNPSLIDPAVAAAIDGSWELVKRPGIVTFVVDTSGSMMGGKIAQARDGLVRALDNMARNNQVGLVTFNDTIDTTIPIRPLAENRFALADAAHEMRAEGRTALYDAIKAGIQMTHDAPGDPDAIRGVVVLTDGRANKGGTRLDQLIKMRSTDETVIRQFGGFENGPAPVTEEGVSVAKNETVGSALALETDNSVQVFFIGVGDDTDLDIGRMLAQATGAEFQGVTEDDLAQVLEEFSKYF